MKALDLAIETGRSADDSAIERLHRQVFGPGRYARTAFRIREAADPASVLVFVARVGTYLVGSVQLTPIRIGGAGACFMLGPLAVEPAFEGRGIGGALLDAAAQKGRSLGGTLILLVGDEGYYARFGYVNVPAGQITLPGPVDPRRLLALELQMGALQSAKGQVFVG